MNSWVQNAIEQWQQEGLELNPAVTSADITLVENKIGFAFPTDFKELYLTINGFVDFEWKSNMISLWSLNRIVEEYDESKELIIFSDFFTSVCQYGFDRETTAIVKAHTHFQQSPIEVIAGSFQEMIELINNDSDLLF